MLFDPASHEPLTGRTWDDRRACEAIAAIAADAENAFSEESLWPAHPIDEEDGPLPRATTLHVGAAGVIWALYELARSGGAELQRDWVEIALSLVDVYRMQPDFPEIVAGPVPSFWMGEAGILLVAHTLSPAPWQEEQLLKAVRANVANPAWEPMWGSPGTMLAAQIMFKRTGAKEWGEAWNVSAERLWAEWRDDVWEQNLYGSRVHYLGPAHGFAGNVFALAQGDMLSPARRAELEARAIAVIANHAVCRDGLAQWPPALEPPRKPQPLRTQWCHGAPGSVTSFAKLAVKDAQLSALLLAGGELTWRAGPLRKGANLCHGTAGNGYAFLKLFERTGDEVWLQRARAFAMHAMEQVEWQRAEYGRGHYTLWTGDLGVALFLSSCLNATADIPAIDYL